MPTARQRGSFTIRRPRTGAPRSAGRCRCRRGADATLRGGVTMKAAGLLRVGAVVGLAAPLAGPAAGQVKIGLIVPMTGQQASTGKQIEAAVKLFMQQNGDTVAGKKV